MYHCTGRRFKIMHDFSRVGSGSGFFFLWMVRSRFGFSLKCGIRIIFTKKSDSNPIFTKRSDSNLIFGIVLLVGNTYNLRYFRPSYRIVVERSTVVSGFGFPSNVGSRTYFLLEGWIRILFLLESRIRILFLLEVRIQILFLLENRLRTLSYSSTFWSKLTVAGAGSSFAFTHPPTVRTPGTLLLNMLWHYFIYSV